jgi:5-formyltetrahydrofolate cyclo-ligase
VSSFVTSALDSAKAELRAKVRARSKTLTAAERGSASAALCARLRQQRIWLEARWVLLFSPLPTEPDVRSLLTEAIADGRTVALPAFEAETGGYSARQVVNPATDLVSGKFGIQEPAANCAGVPLNRLDLVLVSGIAFDSRGGRLGRGKGFYDRLLAAVNGLKCGVAFDEQLVDVVPVGPMDVRVNCILTPTRWIET